MLGKINCQSQNSNTQLFTGESCKTIEALTNCLLITKANAAYDPSTFASKLKEYIELPSNDPLKIWVVKDIIDNPIEGGDIRTASEGYGATKINGYNPTTQRFTMDGGVCLAKQLSSVGTSDYRLFRIDEKLNVFGTITSKDAVSNFAGFLCSLAKEETPQQNGSLYKLVLAVFYSANYQLELNNRQSVQINATPEPLIGVELSKGSSTGTIKVMGLCSSVDYTPIYGSSWKATMFETKGGTALTSVLYDSVKGELKVTPSTGELRLKSPSILSADGVMGIEGVQTYYQLS